MQPTLKHLDVSAYKGLRLPAKIISYVFHPVFMPLTMAVVVSILNSSAFAAIDQKQRMQWFGNLALNTVFFPIVTVLLIKAVGFMESIQMRTMKDRIIPLIGTMIFYFWAYLIFKNIQAPLVLRVLLLGSFWGIVAVFMVNIFMKISMHTSAAGGALGILIVLMMVSHINLFLPFLLVLLVAGLIGTARMVLQAHRPVEIWAGYVIGIIVQMAAYFYLR
jgi:hypothetical protein